MPRAAVKTEVDSAIAAFGTSHYTRAQIDALLAASDPGLKLVEEHEAANSPSLDFTTGITAAHDSYLIDLLNLVPQTTNQDLMMTMRVAGAFDATAKYTTPGFVWVNGGSGVGGASLAAPNTVGHNMTIGNTVKADATIGLCGWLSFKNAPSTTLFKRADGILSWMRHSDSNLIGCYVVTVYKGAPAVDGFKFWFASGNIVSGRVRLYGLSKSA